MQVHTTDEDRDFGLCGNGDFVSILPRTTKLRLERHPSLEPRTRSHHRFSYTATASLLYHHLCPLDQGERGSMRLRQTSGSSITHLPIALWVWLFGGCLPLIRSFSLVARRPSVGHRLPYQPPSLAPQRPCGLLTKKRDYDDDGHDDKGQEHVSVLGAGQNATSVLLIEEMTDERVEYDLADSVVAADEQAVSAANVIVESPPLSFQKFLTMQGKRVIVTIRYSGEAGLKPYFLTAAKKIKASHPDVILERRQTADLDREDPNDEPSFEILVDGKVIVGNNKSRSRKKIGNVHTSIFVSMQELDLAISRARRRRRPSTTVYGEVHEPGDLRLDGLRKDNSIVLHHKHQRWND